MRRHPFPCFPSLATRACLGILAAATTLVANVGSAHACSPPLHRPTKIAPADGKSMPASAYGILLEGDFGTTELFDAQGGAVAGAVKTEGSQKYFAPSAPLTPGSYSFKIESYTGSSPTAVLTTAAIQVTAAVPDPMRTGTLRVAGTERQTSKVPTSSGSCFEDADTAIVNLALDVDPGMAPYADAVAWTTEVDGKHWADDIGSLPAVGAGAPYGTLRLYTACDTTGTSGRMNGLTAGTHDVAVFATVVGSGKTVPAATLRVAVTCGADNGTIDTSVPPNGGDAGADAGEPPRAEDAGIPYGDDGLEAPPERSAGGGGCTVTPPSGLGAGSAGIAAVGAAVALALGARRRRRD